MSLNTVNSISKTTLVESTPILLTRVMNEINRKLSSTVDYKEILDFIFDSLHFIIPYDRIGIAIIEDTGDDARLTLKWVRSKIPVGHLNVSYSSPIKGSSLQTVLDRNQPRVINDLIAYSATHPHSESTKLVIQDGIRSSLTCPLRSGNQQIGVVFFSSCMPYTYQNEHIHKFMDIANELSVIIEIGRMKNEFAACSIQRKNLSMILHDLRSPLSTIQGFAEMSLDQDWFKKIDPEGKEVFKVFLQNSRYMFALLNSLLEVALLNQDADPLSSELVLIKDFCVEMAHFGRTLSEPKEIEFITEISPDLPQMARFDRNKIRRVLDNLFSNAVKFSKRGKKINFRITSEPGRLIFSISDQGPGIPPAEIPKLFQEFGKTSVRPTEGETSTGLGLAIVKRIVEQCQGEVSVSSQVGNGSTFKFWIPISSTSSA